MAEEPESGTGAERVWSDGPPIYRQLRDLVVARILDGELVAGDALPSVRAVAAESRVNPLTVLKAYQELVDAGLVEARRGRGMFVLAGARDALLATEKRRFLAEEWPRVRATIERLGLDPRELVGAREAAAGPHEPASEAEKEEAE